MTDEAHDGPVLRLEPHQIIAKLQLPLRVRVQGIEAVLISAETYDVFLQAPSRSVGTLSRIERDTEVKAYIDARLATHEMKALRQEIAEKFGEDRVPSSSALNRYSIKCRRTAAGITRPERGRRGPRGSG